MLQKIPQEILLDLYERSTNDTMSYGEYTTWLPLICEYALDLVKEKEARERAMAFIKRIEELKRHKK